MRRVEIARALVTVIEESGFVPRGFYAALAKRLRVSRALICMDVKTIRAAARLMKAAAA
jgi:hypothetical protein